MSAEAALKAIARWEAYAPDAPLVAAPWYRERITRPWPDYTFLPVQAGAYAIFTKLWGMKEGAQHVNELSRAAQGGDSDAREAKAYLEQTMSVYTTLATWRMTKGVYEFDAEAFDELWATPITGGVPPTILRKLPEWAVYIPLPERVRSELPAHGFFATVSANPEGYPDVLIIVTVRENYSWGRAEFALDGTALDSQPALAFDGTESDELLAVGKHFPHLLSLLLYLCSEQPEIEGKGQPGNPKPRKIKGGWRTFAAEGVRKWNVGVRIGAALRAAKQTPSSSDSDPTGQRVRAHVRRAHWHTYWTGPRGNQTPILKWLHPVLVNASPENVDELPAVIRPVNKEGKQQ